MCLKHYLIKNFLYLLPTEIYIYCGLTFELQNFISMKKIVF